MNHAFLILSFDYKAKYKVAWKGKRIHLIQTQICCVDCVLRGKMCNNTWNTESVTTRAWSGARRPPAVPDIHLCWIPKGLGTSRFVGRQPGPGRRPEMGWEEAGLWLLTQCCGPIAEGWDLVMFWFVSPGCMQVSKGSWRLGIFPYWFEVL